MMPSTIEQKRAEGSWIAVTQRFGPQLDQHGALAKRYLTAMRQTATRVHVSGLGQSIAFLRSRKDEGGRYAAEDLSSLALQALGRPLAQNADASLQLIRLIQNEDLIFLVRATEEIMGLIAWSSRYLQGAGIEVGDPEDEEDEGNV